MTGYHNLTDNDLIVLLKEDDHLAYAQIYDRYKYILHAHAVNKLRDKEEAMDIIQEVFTYLWAKRQHIEFTGNLSGYLYGAVRNAVLNKITRGLVQEKYLNSMKSFSMHESVVTDHRVRENQLKAHIEREIAMLPPKMKEVFELSRKEYLSHKEIAWKLHISEQTVSKQITNALRILKVKLGILTCLLMLLYR
ncbi:RNA polymerase sigma-70 factor, ECF subfamily [Mucilaginibacter gossypiicola]|uniref:RNA polymerase sigma-70 factor, ECF subfamily n=1 Tax=Mucilaginibacter gossypiicola TaxID=551995 RepID=A0A1H8TXE1_9SPHI|nr:RNA polymerase sigma-70 factor [Mucilaginibacter gossypiicola]SEO95486.1 RNA polymerase sigma-70 factor, ECF subfamily [Mucilaginibacter gossypiicola]